MYAVLDEAAVSAIQLMDNELELAKTKKNLARTHEKQPEKVAVNISEDNFFPEMDQAGVAALEDLDKHLATLRHDGSKKILDDEANHVANLPPLF
ncbi:uncharacterized protein PGTG_00892 [Puccinia graminis f. sp. tritici CRL 75-36-700-3]|uniref:Uncharacterized protein n=1 Tax=Puccinia graminis f. sp. tritici (strain CRL 75-36-700-3 / race SCCL) TaxID=418459 RepID=E3JU36_PUCGT|nr:uncharacterized protein PGTG_00892 [Puccinia graminis f. sp. tritici CRL 75-36-700-3]EFP75561.2 hypothetical protein PGTG_00892 [Puccinia graminis f. sp. tritici CRL 75-36-700-3]